MAIQNQGLLPIKPGTKLGPYEVLEEIGEGAMGVVYRAYHAELERTGAVKVLQAIGPDPDSKARFRREALAIAHMRHPNVLNVYDFGEYMGTPYMVVEFVLGGSLANRLESGPIDREGAIAFLRGIADALDYAHSLGIVHRDVKPANVLLGPEDTPILADFGLAKLLESSSIKSMTGMTTGTPAYMAPEQVVGSEVGPAADRYSLATIAYELLTGAYPFDGEGVMEMLYAHVHREAPAPSSRNPELGPAVDAVILRGLAKDPDERWPTCDEFVSALARALNVLAPPAPVDETIPLVHAVRQAPAAAATLLIHPPASVERTIGVAPAQEQVKRRSRSPYLIGAMVLIPVLLAAWYVGYIVTRPPKLIVLPSTSSVGDQVRPGATPTAPPAQTSTPSTGAAPAGGSTPPATKAAQPLPTSQPTSQPTTQPSTAPTSPPPAPAAAISFSPDHIVAVTGSVTVSGLHFGAGKAITLTFAQGAISSKYYTTAALDGSFAKPINPAAVLGQPATITACDSSNVCVSKPISVTVT
jgi:serine/threonine-protein kinase